MLLRQIQQQSSFSALDCSTEQGVIGPAKVLPYSGVVPPLPARSSSRILLRLYGLIQVRVVFRPLLWRVAGVYFWFSLYRFCNRGSRSTYSLHSWLSNHFADCPAATAPSVLDASHFFSASSALRSFGGVTRQRSGFCSRNLSRDEWQSVLINEDGIIF